MYGIYWLMRLVVSSISVLPALEDLTVLPAVTPRTPSGRRLRISSSRFEKTSFGVRFNGGLQGGDTAVDSQSRDVGIAVRLPQFAVSSGAC